MNINNPSELLVENPDILQIIRSCSIVVILRTFPAPRPSSSPDIMRTWLKTHNCLLGLNATIKPTKLAESVKNEMFKLSMILMFNIVFAGVATRNWVLIFYALLRGF